MHWQTAFNVVAAWELLLVATLACIISLEEPPEKRKSAEHFKCICGRNFTFDLKISDEASDKIGAFIDKHAPWVKDEKDIRMWVVVAVVFQALPIMAAGDFICTLRYKLHKRGCLAVIVSKIGKRK